MAERKLIALVLAVDGYRTIDFVLSSLVNSKIPAIYVIAQCKPQSLIRHVDTMWGGVGAGGRIRMVLPRSDDAADRFEGTVDAVYRNLDLVAQHRPEAVAVFAADRLYRMDVRQMLHAHVERAAYVTVAAGNYVFDPDVLAGLVQRAKKDGGSDLGRDVLPALARCPHVFAYDSARNAFADRVFAAPHFKLANPTWPVRRQTSVESESLVL